MSTHNICFRREIGKNIMWISPFICSYGYVNIFSLFYTDNINVSCKICMILSTHLHFLQMPEGDWVDSVLSPPVLQLRQLQIYFQYLM